MGNLIDRSIPRDDARPKSGGLTEYVADLRPEGMLYARTFRSTRTRARIVSMRVPDLPQGYAVVSHSDVPGRNRVKMLVDDQPFFAEGQVNYVGEPIFLLVGANRETLDDLLSRVVVEYEDLEPIFDVEESASSAVPPIYGGDNRFSAYSFGASREEMERAFARATIHLEEEYQTG